MLLAFCANCSTGAFRGGAPNVGDVVQRRESNTIPFVYDGHVKDLGFWLDSSPETRPFTTFVTHGIDLDADPREWASLVDPTDSRRIVWFVSPFYFTRTNRSLNGYVYRDDFPQKWRQVTSFIATHLSRTLGIWLVDEPDAVACGDQDNRDGIPCGSPGDADWDPNLYNPFISRAAAIIHADLPSVHVGYNVGGGSPAIRIAEGIDLIGLEVYDDDWQPKLQLLETNTSLPIWLLTRAFVNGAPASLDAPTVARLRTQWTWSQHDSRIVAWYPFLECCDDTKTGTGDFYTVGGGHLPLTRQALVEIGMAVRK